MSNKTNIEEDIEKVYDLFQWADDNNINTTKEYKSFENILAYIKRLEKENKELMKVKISTSANTIISDLQKELNEENNRCAKFAVGNNELQAKANKYDSLVKRLKEDIEYGKKFESHLEPTIPEIRAEYAQELLDTESKERK